MSLNKGPNGPFFVPGAHPAQSLTVHFSGAPEISSYLNVIATSRRLVERERHGGPNPPENRLANDCFRAGRTLNVRIMYGENVLFADLPYSYIYRATLPQKWHLDSNK